MRNSICTAAKLYLHGYPTLSKVLGQPHRSHPPAPGFGPKFRKSPCTSTFAPRQPLPQRIRSPEPKLLRRISNTSKTAIEITAIEMTAIEMTAIEMTAIEMTVIESNDSDWMRMRMRMTMRRGGFGSGERMRCGRGCRGANALRKRLSGCECDRCRVANKMSGLDWQCKVLRAGVEKRGGRANRVLRPCK